MKGMSQNKYKLNLNLVPLKSDPHLNEAKISDLKNNFNKYLLPVIENHREKKYCILPFKEFALSWSDREKYHGIQRSLN